MGLLLMGKMCCLLLLTPWCQDSMFARSVTIRCSRPRQSSSMRRPGRHFSRLWGRIHFRKDKNHPTPIRYSKTHLTDYRLHPNPMVTIKMNRKLAYKYDSNDTLKSFCILHLLSSDQIRLRAYTTFNIYPVAGVMRKMRKWARARIPWWGTQRQRIEILNILTFPQVRS